MVEPADAPEHVVFVYGTLQADAVLEAVLQRVPSREAASLDDYRRRLLQNEVYPGIVPRRGETVHGQVLLDVTASELQRLDEYEGDEYERVRVEVTSSSRNQIQAYTYRLKPEHRTRLDPVEDFDLGTFVRRDLAVLLPARWFVEGR